MRKSLSSLSSSSQQTGGHHLLLRRLYHYSSSGCLQLMLVVTCCIFVYVNFQIRTTLSQQQHAPESSQSSSSSLSHSSRNRVEQSPTTEFHTLPVYKDPAVQVLHWSNGTTAIAAATASALSATQQQRNRKKRIADEGQELFNFEPMFGTYRYVASNTKKTNAAIIQFPASDVEPQPRTNSKSHFNNNHNQVRTAPSASNVTAAAMGSYIPQNGVVVTRQGYKFNPEDGQRTPNQDRVVVVQKHVGGDEEKKKDVANRYWWLGLFDGHGQYGQEVSQYCATMFVHYLLHNFWTDEHNEHTALPTHQIQAIIHHYFHDINTQMPSSIGTGSGTTGISILRNGQYLYITNVGDSVAFLVRYDPTPPHRSSDTTPKSASNSIQILYRTSPHKPDQPQERQRIEEAGGRVQVCHHPGCSARLIIPVLATTTDGDDDFGGGEIGLAMSRSLGDHDGVPVGLSAEPDTTILDLTHYSSNTDSSHPSKKSEYFVVAVTDGLVDYGRLSEEEVAVALAHAFTSNKDKTTQPLRKKHSTGQSSEKAALQLILEASKRWKNDQNGGGYRDDISLVAHKLRL